MNNPGMSPQLLSRIVSVSFVGTPPCACAGAWLVWTREDRRQATANWRRIAINIALLLVSISISFGAFALTYWRRSDALAPPKPTIVTPFAGLALVLLALPWSAVTVSWTRAALLLSSLSLIGFYLVLRSHPEKSEASRVGSGAA